MFCSCITYHHVTYATHKELILMQGGWIRLARTAKRAIFFTLPKDAFCNKSKLTSLTNVLCDTCKVKDVLKDEFA